MAHRLTVRDLLDAKGKRKLVLTTAFDQWTARVCQEAGVDMIFASGMVADRFAVLSRQRFPCVGHVGYLPVQSTWFGGPRAVGKTWEEALRVYHDVAALAAAGAYPADRHMISMRADQYDRFVEQLPGPGR